MRKLELSQFGIIVEGISLYAFSSATDKVMKRLNVNINEDNENLWEEIEEVLLCDNEGEFSEVLPFDSSLICEIVMGKEFQYLPDCDYKGINIINDLYLLEDNGNLEIITRCLDDETENYSSSLVRSILESDEEGLYNLLKAVESIIEAN